MDIRDMDIIREKDILKLNFIKRHTEYVFRRHYRQGLRSHILEMLKRRDLEDELKGVKLDGIINYPKARPIKMLRIFRTHFKTRAEVLEEIRRVKILETYLAPDFMAISNEFVVTYKVDGREDILLCGLQEFVEGEIVDPFTPLNYEYVYSLLRRMYPDSPNYLSKLAKKTLINLDEMVKRLKRMVKEGGYIPDLAGVGNLILTKDAIIKLVDINNISRVCYKHNIPLDDKGYPICDRSIDALYHLELSISSKKYIKDDLYNFFLDPARVEEVKELEKRFRYSMKNNGNYLIHT